MSDLDDTLKHSRELLDELVCQVDYLVELDPEDPRWATVAAQLEYLASTLFPSHEDWGGQNVYPICKARNWRG